MFLIAVVFIEVVVGDDEDPENNDDYNDDKDYDENQGPNSPNNGVCCNCNKCSKNCPCVKGGHYCSANCQCGSNCVYKVRKGRGTAIILPPVIRPQTFTLMENYKIIDGVGVKGFDQPTSSHDSRRNALQINVYLESLLKNTMIWLLVYQTML